VTLPVPAPEWVGAALLRSWPAHQDLRVWNHCEVTTEGSHEKSLERGSGPAGALRLIRPRLLSEDLAYGPERVAYRPTWTIRSAAGSYPVSLRVMRYAAT
jgi:hypothetical protein